MKNVKFLKEHKLYDAHEQFMKLAEAYVPIPEALKEDDPEDNMDDMQMPGDDAGMGGNDMAMGAPEGGDMNLGDGAGDMPGMDDGQDQGNADVGEMPEPGEGEDMPMDEPEMPEEPAPEQEEEVIDIDGLTKANERLNVKQNELGRDFAKIDTRITNLMKTLDAFQNIVNDNNKQLNDLKAEFEKRNPTETERLNLRSLDSYPFNVSPTDYWQKKGENGGYQAYSDNDEPTTKEYVITNNDVDDIDDDVANTFFEPEEDDIQTLEKIFKL